jgi:hypothetical protein
MLPRLLMLLLRRPTLLPQPTRLLQLMLLLRRPTLLHQPTRLLLRPTLLGQPTRLLRRLTHLLQPTLLRHLRPIVHELLILILVNQDLF